jgi:hypothetical protein
LIIVVTGSRYWNNKNAIRRELLDMQRTYTIDAIIEGGAEGADRQCKEVARELGIPVTTVHAQWDKYGKHAGPMRNEKMISQYKPSYVLAFHDNIASSRGTSSCIAIARKYGVTVKLVES